MAGAVKAALEELAPGPRAVAEALLRARAAGVPAAAAPLADALQSADEAYAVQQAVARAAGWQDADVPRHWKSGAPRRDAVFTHAPLPPAGVWASPARSAGWHFNVCLVEAEVALRLARAVTPAQAAALRPGQGAELVDAMAAAIELVDSRWEEGMQAPPLLKLADLQSHGAFVLGPWRPFVARDWARQVCEVTIVEARPRGFRGSHPLGDPAWLVAAWLQHATRNGEAVPAGTVLTTGTWCGMLPAQAGERVQVQFEGIGAAEVHL